MASLPCLALPSIIFSDGKVRLLGGTPRLGASDLDVSGALGGGAGALLRDREVHFNSSNRLLITICL